MAVYKKVPGCETVNISTLEFDTKPTPGSFNPVTSDSIATQSGNIAKAFSASSTYAIGEVVVGPDGKLYQCTTAVETAGEWDPEDWGETSLGDILFILRGSSNIEVRKSNCKVGDAVYADSDGNVHFIVGQSVKSSAIPEDWEFVGVVALREGTKATILHKSENASIKFASCWQYEIAGIKFNQSNTIQFQQAKTSGSVNIGDPFTFTPTDIDDAVDKIDEFLRDNAGGVAAGAGWNYNWHCEKLPNPSGVDSVVVVADNNVDYRQAASIINSSGTTTGITSNLNMCDFIPAYTTMLRNNSGNGNRVGFIKDQLLEYYATNTTIANPTSMVPVNSANDIVSKTQFEENQYCADLRDAYGTFENYIESVILAWPSDEGNQVYMNGTGKEYTELLAARKHKNLSGTETSTYPAAAYSTGIGYQAEGLEEGNWYLPDAIEFFEIFKDMKVDGTDVVNATQKRATGSALSLSVNRWLPARSGQRTAWSITSSGVSNSSFLSFHSSSRACCVAQYDVVE